MQGVVNASRRNVVQVCINLLNQLCGWKSGHAQIADAHAQSWRAALASLFADADPWWMLHLLLHWLEYALEAIWLEHEIHEKLECM